MYMIAIADLCCRSLGCQPSFEPAHQRVGEVLQVGPVVVRHCRLTVAAVGNAPLSSTTGSAALWKREDAIKFGIPRQGVLPRASPCRIAADVHAPSHEILPRRMGK